MSSFIRNLNNKILKLNNLAFVSIIVIYIVILVFLLFIISPQYDKVILPNYEHNNYPETINPRILVVGDSELVGEEIKTEYDIYLRLQGRLVDDSDPRYEIERMQMSALTTQNRLHYFTEYEDFITPMTHGFLPITDGAPEQFFIKLEYLDINGDKQIETFREDMMLELANRSKYSQYNKITHLVDEEVFTDLELQVIATKLEENYRTSIRMLIGDFSKKYHIDMQSWIVTEDGNVIPYIGVYGYSDQRSSFTDSNRLISLDIKPKTIYVRVNYIENDKLQSIYYCNDFDNLTEKYSDIPEVEPQTSSGISTLQVILICVGAVIISSIITVIIVNITRKNSLTKKSRKKS